MKKIAIFADIHGNLEALKAIAGDAKSKGIDKIICLGDLINLGPSSKECIVYARENNIQLISGNHELYIINSKLTSSEFNSLNPNEKKHYEWVRESLDEDDLKYIEKAPLEIDISNFRKKIKMSHYVLTNKPDKVFFDFDNHEEALASIPKDVKINFVGHNHNGEHNGRIYGLSASGCTKDNITFYYVVTMKLGLVKVKKIKIRYDRNLFEGKFSESVMPDKEDIGNIFFGIK